MTKITEKLYVREKYLQRIRGFYDKCELIKVFTGIRRSGKSTIMKLIINELLDKGVDEKNIIYLNLDKRPFIGVRSGEELNKLIESKIKDVSGLIYLFIDEVQNVKNFETVINAYREEGNISIFITGSNSYLLSGELVTKLTGRYIEFEIGTLNFLEYIEMKKFFNIEVLSDLEEEFNNYILYGGFPYSVLLESEDQKRLYINNLIDEIFSKDIKRNNKIKNRLLFNQVQQFIINNFGSTISVNKICDSLELVNGIRPNKRTIYSYLEILENAKIIEKCKRFDLKSRKSLQGEEKIYLTDLSIYFATNNDQRFNYGPILENIIFNYAKYKGYSLSIGKIGKLEVDFVARKNNEYSYIQVAYTIHGEANEKGIPYVEEREYRSLEEIKDNYPKFVLTLDKHLQKRNGIKNLNIINVILNNENLSY